MAIGPQRETTVRIQLKCDGARNDVNFTLLDVPAGGLPQVVFSLTPPLTQVQPLRGRCCPTPGRWSGWPSGFCSVLDLICIMRDLLQISELKLVVSEGEGPGGAVTAGGAEKGGVCEPGRVSIH